MTTSIVSRVLGSNTFYTDSYIEDTITFVKSFLVKNDNEAKLYNDQIKLDYPAYSTGYDKVTWRYYLHLSGEKHHLDPVITFVSVDNGDTVELTKSSLLVHRKTKEELLTFGLLYDSLIAKYPSQQLYIRSILLNHIYPDIYALINLEDFTITAYNSRYIEENEHDVVPQLQARINNYKSIWLIPYYQNLDNLFLASQYSVLYNFIFTSLLAIRLSNAKTIKAHSFHIKLYLASHYHLDEQMPFLSRRQQLYLYRNLLYLGNHSGKNHIFRSLINELFNEHNVSVVNYVQSQTDVVDTEGYVEYSYNQKLLNSKSLLYYSNDLGLPYLSGKESGITPSNSKEYTYNYKYIDRRNKRALISKLLTKDLETILVDETDSVKNKLVDSLTDYWAYLLKTNQLNYIVEITDPVTNNTARLSTKDLFKLFAIAVSASGGNKIDEFPTYQISRVFASDLPTVDELTSVFYHRKFDHTEQVEIIRSVVPPYKQMSTSYEFGEFVNDIYELDIGLWHMLSNYSDIDTNGQFANTVSNLYISDTYVYNDETVSDFLSRTGVKDPREYDNDVLVSYVFAILDGLFDNKLTYIKRLKKLQSALSEVFFKFNSYTVQLINNYYNDTQILAGIKDRRYSLTEKVTVNIGNGGGSEPDTLVPDIFLKGSSFGLMPFKILNDLPSFRNISRLEYMSEFYAGYQDKFKAVVVYDIPPGLDISVTDSSIVNIPTDHILLTDTDDITKLRTDLSLEFKTNATVLSSKLTLDIPVSLSIKIESKVKYISYMHTDVDLGVVAEDFPKQVLESESNDPVLLFLALNL